MSFGGKETKIMCPTYSAGSKLYKYHIVNLRSIDIALKSTAISTRNAIAEENKNVTDSFVRLYALLIGAWAETRLKKLMFEPSGFGEVESKVILSQKSQLQTWKKAVEVAFRKQYKVPSAKLTSHTIPFTAFSRYSAILEILDQDLRSVIEIRNKLAHGQWIYPLVGDGTISGTKVDPCKYRQLKQENLPALQYKLKLISSIADTIHDLVVSVATFERDFDAHFNAITTTKNNMKNRPYSDYAKKMVAKRKNGIEKRKKNKA